MERRAERTVSATRDAHTCTFSIVTAPTLSSFVFSAIASFLIVIFSSSLNPYHWLATCLSPNKVPISSRVLPFVSGKLRLPSVILQRLMIGNEDSHKIHYYDIDDAGADQHEIESPSNLVHSDRGSYKGDFARQVERSNAQRYSLRTKVIGKDLSDVYVLRTDQKSIEYEQKDSWYSRIEKEAPPENEEENKEHGSPQTSYIVGVKILSS
jgi:hypothetical protein